jgi:hypothetical protein
MALALGIEDSDGTILAIYVHSDGIAEHGGCTVAQHYRTWELAQSLVSLGDLSWVGSSIGTQVDFDSEHAAMVYDVPKQCLAYTRDRGEPWEQNQPKRFQGRDEFRRAFSEGRAQYLYVFNRKCCRWVAVA